MGWDMGSSSEPKEVFTEVLRSSLSPLLPACRSFPMQEMED